MEEVRDQTCFEKISVTQRGKFIPKTARHSEQISVRICQYQQSVMQLCETVPPTDVVSTEDKCFTQGISVSKCDLWGKVELLMIVKNMLHTIYKMS